MKGCDICNAKQKTRIGYRDKNLCSECFYEYRTIFEGILSKRTQKRIAYEGTNPLLSAFKRGWEEVEREKGLAPLPVPPWVEEFYSHIYKRPSTTWDEDEIS